MINLAEAELLEIRRVMAAVAETLGLDPAVMLNYLRARFPGCFADTDLNAAQRRDWLNTLRSYQRGESMPAVFQYELPLRRT